MQLFASDGGKVRKLGKKIITRKFIGIFVNKLVGGLSPDLVTEQKALDHITKSVEGGDDQVFAIVCVAGSMKRD